MNQIEDITLPKALEFDRLYRMDLLYRSVSALYTKVLFFRQKARTVSWDGKDLYEFAHHTDDGIRKLHRELVTHQFRFSPAKPLHLFKGGKERVAYIWPWRERVVDLMLYQMLDRQLDSLFSNDVFAFRRHRGGVDSCQHRIERFVRANASRPLYLLKRDVSNCFPSIPHPLLMNLVEKISPPDDYLCQLLKQHIAFNYYEDAETLLTATQGVPFGAPTACLLANLALRPFDGIVSQFKDCCYTRYADDMLFLTPIAENAIAAREQFDSMFARLGLVSKSSASTDGVLSLEKIHDSDGFEQVRGLKHLGVYYNPGGKISLAVDKQRKIFSLFRHGFRRCRRQLARFKDCHARARLLCKAARRTLEKVFTPIAIIDYYLKHVNDIHQLEQVDRWLAEEVLSLTFQNGHKKGNFGKLSFEELRQMGLPSLVHRRRLLLHGHLDTSFLSLRASFAK